MNINNKRINYIQYLRAFSVLLVLFYQNWCGYCKEIIPEYKKLGKKEKNFIKSEVISRKNARRSVVLNIDLNKGMKIKGEHLICKRPATGISPKYIKKIIGKRIKRKIFSDTILRWGHLK